LITIPYTAIHSHRLLIQIWNTNVFTVHINPNWCLIHQETVQNNQPIRS
jgi:hypothetical protein